MNDKQTAIAEAIHDGASIAQAAQMVGVPEPTARGWLKFGRKNPTGPFGEFACRVDQLRERISVPLDTGPGRMVTSVDAHLAVLTLSTAQAVQAAALRTVAEILDWAETMGDGPAVRILVSGSAEVARAQDELLTAGGMFALIERLWDITEGMVAEGELEPVERSTRGRVAAQTRFRTVEDAVLVHVQSLGDLTTAQAVTVEALRKEAVALDLARKARSGAVKIPSVAALREITRLLAGGGEPPPGLPRGCAGVVVWPCCGDGERGEHQ